MPLPKGTTRLKTIRKTARERVKEHCRVCPVCNGVACAGEVPGMGGIGTGSAFRANLSSLAAYRLEMRLLHDAATPATAISLFGHGSDRLRRYCIDRPGNFAAVGKVDSRFSHGRTP
jgi:hypothetical protein